MIFFKRGSIVAILALFVWCGSRYFVALESQNISSTMVEAENLRPSIKELSVNKTQDSLKVLETVKEDKHFETALRVFHEERSNVFFDKELFFQNVNLDSKSIRDAYKRLSNTRELSSLGEIDRDNFPKLLDERMSLIDFLAYSAVYNSEKELSLQVQDAFSELLNLEISQGESIAVQQVLQAEKMDYIRYLTVLDRDKAVDLLSFLENKEALLPNFYRALKSLDLSEEEYAFYLEKVR